MTRDQCIEAMARAMHDGPLGVDVLYNEVSPASGGLDSTIWCREMATAAYDAMADHIRAREEAVRERCLCVVTQERANVASHEQTPATHCAVAYMTLIGTAIRALDIGGPGDG